MKRKSSNHPLALTPHEVALIRAALATIPKITGAIVVGSHSKRTIESTSNIDLALLGIDDPIAAEAAADILEGLPLPYRFDVTVLSTIKSAAKREHIRKVGFPIYTAASSNSR